MLVSLDEFRKITGGLFFFSSRRRHTRFDCDWSSDVCSSDLDWRRLHQDLVSRWTFPWADAIAGRRVERNANRQWIFYFCGYRDGRNYSGDAKNDSFHPPAES